MCQSFPAQELPQSEDYCERLQRKHATVNSHGYSQLASSQYTEFSNRQIFQDSALLVFSFDSLNKHL